MESSEAAPETAAPVCPHCLKPAELCVCESVTPVANGIALLILQHPQEQDKLLGTARLTAHHLTNATFKVGLSWPSLAKALGRPADPKRWATLFLGATKGADFPPGQEIAVFDRKGKPVADQPRALADIEGVILLDGTWSQAKTLWWRNAWLLKSKRIALKPKRPSLYGKLRREARREGLSTIEAAGMALARLERRPEIETALTDTFSLMLRRYQAAERAKPDTQPAA